MEGHPQTWGGGGAEPPSVSQGTFCAGSWLVPCRGSGDPGRGRTPTLDARSRGRPGAPRVGPTPGRALPATVRDAPAMNCNLW